VFKGQSEHGSQTMVWVESAPKLFPSEATEHGRLGWMSELPVGSPASPLFA
jgi:hypothetical protein